MSLDQLKILAYDQLVLLEQAQQNIKIINEQIVNKSKVEQTKELKQVDTKKQ